jgi:GH24 family phage-related lysozyme (muramidase)
MEYAQRAVMTLVKTRLTDGQYAALCDFTYNVGSENLKKSTLPRVPVLHGSAGRVLAKGTVE